MNKFFDTAVGKSAQTLLWICAAYVLVAMGAYIANVQWDPQLVALGLPGLVNWLLYTAKVIVDKEIPNLPGSTPMQLVPVAPSTLPVASTSVTIDAATPSTPASV